MITKYVLGGGHPDVADKGIRSNVNELTHVTHVFWTRISDLFSHRFSSPLAV